MERSRQYQKLQSMYDAMRRKCITTSTFDGSEDGGTSNNALKNVQNFSLSLSSGEDFLRKTNKMQHHHHPSSRLSSPPERDFSVTPRSTPVVTTGGGDISAMQRRFSLNISTPR